MAWRRPGDKPLTEPMMVSLPTHMCVNRPQWVKFMAQNVHTGVLCFVLLIYLPISVRVASLELVLYYLFAIEAITKGIGKTTLYWTTTMNYKYSAVPL